MMRDCINAELFKEISGLAKQIEKLTKEAVVRFKPQVDNIIQHCVTDSKQIEPLLDVLLDYASMNVDGLVLFKRLCKYYYTINPRVTAAYVYTYRDLYDSDADDKSEYESPKNWQR